MLLNYSTQDSKHLIKTLKAIRDEGRDVIGVSASGIYKLHKMKQQDTKFLDRWLDGFLLSRNFDSNLRQVLSFWAPYGTAATKLPSIGRAR